MITAAQLVRIYTACPFERAQRYEVSLVHSMAEFAINSPPRATCFLAQVGHESGQLRYVAEVWGPSATQLKYEGRRDLGNVLPGDGFRFRGRGLIQITGHDNYARVSNALYQDTRLIQSPELLEETEPACRSAGWFWQSHGLNELADLGDMRSITRRINGGLNGYDERMRLYARARTVL